LENLDNLLYLKIGLLSPYFYFCLSGVPSEYLKRNLGCFWAEFGLFWMRAGGTICILPLTGKS